ncbi:MAG: hypothetical protein WCS77_00260 [Elusimicrobiaceae bacterium]
MIKTLYRLFIFLLTNTREAYVCIEKNEKAFAASAVLFAACILLESAFMFFLPQGYMPGAEKITQPFHLFLLIQCGTEIIITALTLLFVFIFGSIARKKPGLTFLFFVLAALLVPLMAVVSFQNNTPASTGLLFAILALVFGGMVQFAGDRSIPVKRILAVLMLSNAFTIPLIPCQALAALTGSAVATQAVLFVFSLLMIRFIILGSAYFLRVSTAKSAAVLIAGFMGAFVIFLAFAKTGAIPGLDPGEVLASPTENAGKANK